MNSFNSFKTIWRDKYTHLWVFYCPLCATQRRLPFRSKPGGILHLSQVVLTSLVFTLICWEWLGWKGVFSFFPLWTGFELVYRARVRVHLACKQCGFDPYLFLIDEEWAKKEVDGHWRKKFAEKGIPYPEKSAKSLRVPRA